MRIDVSEVKTFRNCHRQWAFGSRNKWNLKSKIPMPALRFGTLFHECLASLYVGTPLEKILKHIETQIADPSELRTLTAMVTGYASEVLPEDLNTYIVKDIEHHFELSISPFKEHGIQLCGSIDMICLKEIPAKNEGDKPVFEVWGFEHKSCGRFRDPLYTSMDEQPRLYTIALIEYIKDLQAKTPDVEFVLGGIFLNEVRKVQRNFDYKRTTCVYSPEDLERFCKGFYMSCTQIKEYMEEDIPLPDPGMMKCTMCMYKNLCEEYAYATPTLPDVLKEFEDEFEERAVDHLDEKQEKNL